MPVIRHDTPDARYRIDRADFPALIDMPDMGHGVLIAERWVVTAAHTIRDDIEDGGLQRVSHYGAPLGVAGVHLHPGFRGLPVDWERLDCPAANAFLAARDDIALIELTAPIAGVTPTPLYRTSDEDGAIVQIIGKGMTGDGESGLDFGSPFRGRTRRVRNRIEAAKGRWLNYVFNPPPQALPLEGMHGSGDSGGPGLIEADGVWRLAGLTSWTWATGERSRFQPGLYGQLAFQVRVSHYLRWIDMFVREAR